MTTQIITRVVFHEGVAVPSHGLETCREFRASEGWTFELTLTGVQLTRADGRSYVVGGTGFVAHVETIAPVGEPEPEPRKLQLVKPARGGDGKFRRKGPGK